MEDFKSKSTIYANVNLDPNIQNLSLLKLGSNLK